VSLRAISIAIVACGLLAAAVAWSTDQFEFAVWLRFTLVGFAVVYLFSFFKNRASEKGSLDGEPS